MPGVSYHHISKIRIIKIALLVSSLYHSKKSHIQVLICDNLRTVTIKYSSMDAASSLLMHWCQLWLWCIDVPGVSYHHISKVTEIKLSLLLSLVYHSKKSHIQVLICDNLRTVTIKVTHKLDRKSSSDHPPKVSYIKENMSQKLTMVTIQCGSIDAVKSLLMHWCQLWLWCIDVPGLSYHHIGKVTEIKLSLLVSLVYHSKKSHIQVLICEKWRTVTIKLAVWMQPVAYWCTDVNFE